MEKFNEGDEVMFKKEAFQENSLKLGSYGKIWHSSDNKHVIHGGTFLKENLGTLYLPDGEDRWWVEYIDDRSNKVRLSFSTDMLVLLNKKTITEDYSIF